MCYFECVFGLQAYPCSVVSFCSFVPSVAGLTPAGVCVCVCVSVTVCVCIFFPSLREIIACFHPKLEQAVEDDYSTRAGVSCPVKWIFTVSHSA